MRRRRGFAAAALVLLVTACSNTSSAVSKEAHPGAATASDTGGVQQVTVTTGSDYRFHPSTITAHTGSLRIVLKNAAGSGAPHNLQVDSVANAFVPLARAGTTTQATFTVNSPGTYRFVCTIHVVQGQTGTLVVKPTP